MSHAMAAAPALMVAGHSPVIRAYGDQIHLHLSGDQTEGRYTMFTDVTPPAGGPPPHFHLREDEWFYLLEGRVEFLRDDSWIELPVGSSVFMPRNSVHTFRNVDHQASRLLINTAPSGIEAFFKESAAEFQKPGTPDLQCLLEIGARHGIFFPGVARTGSFTPEPPALLPAIVRAEDGRLYRLFGEEITLLLEGRQTGGLFTSFLERTLPGGGPPPHYLVEHDEWCFVLEGEISFFDHGQWTATSAGASFYAPRGSVHTFKNTGHRPARMLVHTAPSGIEKFFERAHAEFARPGRPDLSQARAIAEEHGIRFVE